MILDVEVRNDRSHIGGSGERQLSAAECGLEICPGTVATANLLRQVVYEGLREDKPAAEVRREVPHPKTGTGRRTAAANKSPIRRR